MKKISKNLKKGLTLAWGGVIITGLKKSFFFFACQKRRLT